MMSTTMIGVCEISLTWQTPQQWLAALLHEPRPQLDRTAPVAECTEEDPERWDGMS